MFLATISRIIAKFLHRRKLTLHERHEKFLPDLWKDWSSLLAYERLLKQVGLLLDIHYSKENTGPSGEMKTVKPEFQQDLGETAYIASMVENSKNPKSVFFKAPFIDPISTITNLISKTFIDQEFEKMLVFHKTTLKTIQERAISLSENYFESRNAAFEFEATLKNRGLDNSHFVVVHDQLIVMAKDPETRKVVYEELRKIPILDVAHLIRTGEMKFVSRTARI